MAWIAIDYGPVQPMGRTISGHKSRRLEESPATEAWEFLDAAKTVCAPHHDLNNTGSAKSTLLDRTMQSTRSM